MTRCPNSSPKHRHSNTGKGNPSNYKHGMRGCSWEKIEYGRKCRNCPKKHFKPLKKGEIK